MIEANKFKIGLFTVCAIIILFVTLFLISLRSMFEPKLELMTVYGESVQGLSEGSDVKFRGVPVGKVTRILILPHGEGILVGMELSFKAFDPALELSVDNTVSKNKNPDVSYAYIQAEIDKGLRAQLELSGITGMKYIEIDYYAKPGDNFDSKLIPPPEVLGDAYFIPSEQSLMTGIKSSATRIIANVQTAVDKFNSLNFDALNTTFINVEQAVSELRTEIKVKGEQIDDIFEKVYNTVDYADTIIQRANVWSKKVNIESISETLENLRLLSIDAKQMMLRADSQLNALQLQQLSERARSILVSLDSNLKTLDLNAQIAKVTGSVDAMAQDVRDASLSFIRIREEFQRTLIQMRAPLSAISELLETLQRDPSALIKGERPPRTALPEKPLNNVSEMPVK